MIEFVCPGCLSTHSANQAFAGLRARCVVCGAAIVIPESSGEVAPSWDLDSRSSSGTASRPAKPSVSARPITLEPDEVEEDEDDSIDDDDALDESSPRVRKRPHKNEEELLAYNKLDDEELLGEESESESEPGSKFKKKKPKTMGDSEATEPAEDATEADAPLSPEELRKKQIRIGIAIGVTVLCVSMAVYVAFFRGDSTPKFEPPPPPPKKPEPPPPKPPEPVPPPAVPIAPAPRPYRPTNQFTAASFFLERNADPVGFDKIYSGSYLIIQGTHSRSANGTIALADNSDDTEGIVCVLPKPAGTQPAPTVEMPVSTPLKRGQAVTVRGIYTSALRMIESEVLKTDSPADEKYKDTNIEIAGIVALTKQDDVVERFPTVSIEPMATDSPITIRCLFPASDEEKIAKLRPGQAVTIRGRCDGRSFRSVQLHNCTLVGPSDPADPAFLRVASDQFFAAYETDLLPAPRPGPETNAIPVTAEQLASAFETNPKQANLNYRHKLVQISGRMLERRAGNRTILLETRTNDRYQITAAFNAAKFALIHNEKEVLIRGTCVGVRDGRFVRIENAELLDLEPRLVAEFLPFEAGRELLYDTLTPLKAKDNPITQLKVRVNDPDLIGTIAIRSGIFPGGTLFGDPSLQPRWTRDLTKLKVPPSPLISQHRLKDDTVEIRPFPIPPIQPSPWWDPVLKLGSKKGESWSSEMPDGRIITYTVMNFKKDEAQRQMVDIRRVSKNPKAAAIWEESVITYTRDLGEVRRIVTNQFIAGNAVVVLEMRLVESGIEGTVELTGRKNEPDKKEPDKKDGKQ